MILRIGNFNYLRTCLPISKSKQITTATIILKRFYAKEHQRGPSSSESKKDAAITDKVGPERSYLEEILLEKDQGPKTTGQKGMKLLKFFTSNF